MRIKVNIVYENTVVDVNVYVCVLVFFVSDNVSHLTVTHWKSNTCSSTFTKETKSYITKWYRVFFLTYFIVFHSLGRLYIYVYALYKKYPLLINPCEYL